MQKALGRSQKFIDSLNAKKEYQWVSAAMQRMELCLSVLKAGMLPGLQPSGHERRHGSDAKMELRVVPSCFI